jgi:hypothetical protein
METSRRQNHPRRDAAGGQGDSSEQRVGASPGGQEVPRTLGEKRFERRQGRIMGHKITTARLTSNYPESSLRPSVRPAAGPSLIRAHATARQVKTATESGRKMAPMTWYLCPRTGRLQGRNQIELDRLRYSLGSVANAELGAGELDIVVDRSLRQAK